MIRDEFKNADKEQLKKKSNEKMQKMGERAYYAKKLSFYSEIVKPVNVATIFCTVCFLIMAGLHILNAVLSNDWSAKAIIITAVGGIMLIWCIVWFAFLKHLCVKKAVYYKEELGRLSREYVMKSTGRR